jgi:hypothetical protein
VVRGLAFVQEGGRKVLTLSLSRIRHALGVHLACVTRRDVAHPLDT